MKNKKLVYISHPSGGKEENTRHIEKIISTLLDSDTLYSKYCFVSPVHCYGFMYETCDYSKGLSFCTDLLKHCDIMLLCGEWESSKGCTAERQMCIDRNIPILEVRTDKDIEKLVEIGSIEYMMQVVQNK